MICQYCSVSFVKSGSLKNHEVRCPSNPSRVIQRGRKGKPAWSRGLTKETSEILLNSAKKISQAQLGKPGRKHTPETKDKLSKVAYQRGLGGHTSKKKLYFQKRDGSVVYLQSSYESRFATILEQLGVLWERPEPLLWVDDFGKKHRYYPDFLVEGVYVDTKNPYLIKKDSRKIELVRNQNQVHLEVVGEENITEEHVLALVAQLGRATAL